MNVLQVGMVFKSYKELCEFLGEPVKTGRSKQLQMDEFEKMFKHTKSGWSMEITEVFKQDEFSRASIRSENNNNISIRHLNRLIDPSCNIKLEDMDKMGVYAITFENNVYIGSSVKLSNRFLAHKHKSPNENIDTPSMLKMGGIFTPIFIMDDVEDVGLLRLVEDVFIEHFKNDKDYNCINSKTTNYSQERAIKKYKKTYKKIIVPADKYELALEVLRYNGVL
jgi:predicted GIY-YIG superfamily endonuclease